MSPSTIQRRIQLARIAHVYYTHVNIDAAKAFLVDFGFFESKKVGKKTYFRGYGSEPFLYCAQQGEEDSFEGTAFVVQSREDLELAARILPGASEIYDLVDAPGGGQCVTFHDPVDKFPYHLVHGQTLVEPSDDFPELRFNFVSLLIVVLTLR